MIEMYSMEMGCSCLFLIKCSLVFAALAVNENPPQKSRVQSQHPSSLWNLRGGTWSNEEKCGLNWQKPKKELWTPKRWFIWVTFYNLKSCFTYVNEIFVNYCKSWKQIKSTVYSSGNCKHMQLKYYLIILFSGMLMSFFP